MTKKVLTSVEQEYFDAFVSHHLRTGLFPTVREIMDLTGRSSPSSVQAGLFRLEEKGWIEKTGVTGEARMWQIKRPDQVTCPLGLPVRPGAIGYYRGAVLKGIWTPADLLTS
jgi:SOS-response transcriptional repressor LexA